MDKLAYGFWGWYFGTTALMLAGSAIAFNAVLSAAARSFFALAFLGGLPRSDPDTHPAWVSSRALIGAVFTTFALLQIV